MACNRARSKRSWSATEVNQNCEILSQIWSFVFTWGEQPKHRLCLQSSRAVCAFVFRMQKEENISECISAAR